MSYQILKSRDKKTIIDLAVNEELDSREISHYFERIGRPEVNYELIKRFRSTVGYGMYQLKRQKKELKIVADSIDLDIDDDSLGPLVSAILLRKIEKESLQYPTDPSERLDFFISEAERLAHQNKNDAYLMGMSVAVMEKLYNLKSKFAPKIEESKEFTVDVKFEL